MKIRDNMKTFLTFSLLCYMYVFPLLTIEGVSYLMCSVANNSFDFNEWTIYDTTCFSIITCIAMIEYLFLIGINSINITNSENGREKERASKDVYDLAKLQNYLALFGVIIFTIIFGELVMANRDYTMQTWNYIDSNWINIFGIVYIIVMLVSGLCLIPCDSNEERDTP